MSLILQSGASHPVKDANSFVSVADFSGFLSSRGYPSLTTKEQLLIRSYDFIQILPFKPEYCRVKNDCTITLKYDADQNLIDPPVFVIPPNILRAQMFLGWCMSDKGGELDATKGTDARQLTRRAIGRNSIEREWSFDKELAKTDSLSLLKRCPLAYALLDDFLINNSFNFGIRRT